VHYLHSDKELSRRLGGYLDLINSGEEPLKAFEAGFGVSPQEFHKSARKYFEADQFKVQQFKPKPEFLSVKMKQKRLTKGELDLQMALGQRSFLSKKTLNNFSKRLNSFENEHGQTAQSYSARATYYINTKDFESALKYSQAALHICVPFDVDLWCFRHTANFFSIGRRRSLRVRLLGCK